MLRLKEIRREQRMSLEEVGTFDEILLVTFEGEIAPYAECTVTLSMAERPTDAALLRDSEAALFSAIAALHADLQQSASKGE